MSDGPALAISASRAKSPRVRVCRIVEAEVGQQRHAVIFDLPVADHALAVGVVQDQRPQQIFPVRGDVGGPVLADETEIFTPVFVVGHRQGLARRRQPLHLARALPALTAGLPERRIGPPQLE